MKQERLKKEWNIDTNKLDHYFEKNHQYFTFNGGDMETLLHKCKNAHSKRTINFRGEIKEF